MFARGPSRPGEGKKNEDRGEQVSCKVGAVASSDVKLQQQREEATGVVSKHNVKGRAENGLVIRGTFPSGIWPTKKTKTKRMRMLASRMLQKKKKQKEWA